MSEDKNLWTTLHPAIANIRKQQGTTLVQRAFANVKGSNALHKRLEKKIIVSGKSMSTLSNYMRCIAHIALKYNCLPSQLDLEQIEDYLLHLKKKGAFEADFKLTVYGLRFLFRCDGLNDRAIKLPSIKRDKKTPRRAQPKEMQALLKAPTLLKHRILIGDLYGYGLRCHEVRSLLIKDVDFDRNMIHVRQGKGRKDRYVPLGDPQACQRRYSHRVAISNHRIVDVQNDQVIFRYKDYRDESKVKLMTLQAIEFIRRFSLHILPKGFMRIRHYDILSSSRKQHILPLLHPQLESRYEYTEEKHWKQISTERLGYNPDGCPVCKQIAMITIFTFDRRGPPDGEMIKDLIIRPSKLRKSYAQLLL